MLKRTFDKNKAYKAVIYARMSSKRQNERSPDQQIAEIKRTIERQNLDWAILGIYRDDGVKGAHLQKRRDFSRLLNDIHSDALQVDLILVDTTERFARSTELNTIRQRLWDVHGVLLLTAESGFSSPLTPQGVVYAAVEAMRSTEENRVKAHQVVRAKRDTIEHGNWPGGKAPRGYVLKKIIKEKNGNDEFVGSKLILDSATVNVDIIKEAFGICIEKGIRGSKLATHLKAMPEFRAEFSRLSGETVNNWLRNTIYKGVLTWGLYSTGIINDVRRLERNDPEDVVVKRDFCEPIVSEEKWNLANLGRTEIVVTSDDESDKLLKPVAPAFTINNMLAGLVRCAGCSGSMGPVTSTSEAGVKYTYYRCQRTADDNCDNRVYIHEHWLRTKVIGYLRDKILGASESRPDAAAKPSEVDLEDPAFNFKSKEVADEITSLIERRLKVLCSTQNDGRPAIKKHIEEVAGKIYGWTSSLSSPELSGEVRRSIEVELNSAFETKRKFEEALNQLECVFASQEIKLDHQKVRRSMSRLSDVLAGENPSLTNIELSLHIDKIVCNPDGTVDVRFCKLGLAGVDVIKSIDQTSFNNSVVADDDQPTDPGKCLSRRRARLSVSSDLYNKWDLESLAHWATDPKRFDYLDDCWFEDVSFIRPPQKCWAEENAIAVAKRRLEDSLTFEALAKAFEVSIPTINKSLKIAAKLDPKYAEIPKKMPRPRWHEDHALEVFEARKTMSMKQMVLHFSKSDVTLNKAIRFANEILNLS